ncbi:MAG: UDP-N-acetylmuramoyl-L-alanyl-D-glutamate--2,6-diaminopimelate ligase [Coriobacteriales bacterium]|jgi:UDP-N-acetylmuramoyl-L-alanyl-D-glutamate--2,6-diaminopimelate ligase|nr:UDP-N-acetylmuramoyl-L-alanyl-D-glutamate--2,6-diaminopimelate ligase [Coriobacteriales bacterium]
MPELVDQYLLPISLLELSQRLADADELVETIGIAMQPDEQYVPTHLSYDSRDVIPGSLFFCKGAYFQPDYFNDALLKGAAAYVSETVMPGQVPGLIVRDVRRAMALTAAWYYANLLKKLTIIGVTGTKGKSTTVYFIKSILDAWMTVENEPASAILSSIDNYDGIIFEESHITTKESLDLYRHFANAVSSGISYLAMEVSSQALKYHRVTAVPFTVGCFLNFGRDHISAIEHPDAQDYLAQKLKIFGQSEVACVNLGTEQVEQVVYASKASEWLITFGWSEFAELSATYHADKGVSGSCFTALMFGQEVQFDLALAGRFNVENALAAIASTIALGVPIDIIQQGLAKARVPGRMEPFAALQDKLILVDYAHNLMSFEALFSSVKASYPNSYIAIVFGCPGYKALDRRIDLGTVAGREADDVVLTEEDSGDEPTIDICNDIASHVKAAGGNPRIILDRSEAIESAIDLAPAGSVILITGKGRETRQKRGKEYIEVVSDVQIVEDYISEHQ